MKKHTEETKKLMSEKRKTYLQANKNQHPWSRFNRKESQPERIFRESLIALNIDGYQNFTPPDSKRNFEIDFALPNKKIGFEVNGQQHYESDGSLKEYYQKRHDYINSLGWILHEIHYSECLYDSNTQSLITRLLINENIEYSSEAKVINYREIKKKAKEKFCIDCNNSIFRSSIRCFPCSSKEQKRLNIENQKINNFPKEINRKLKMKRERTKSFRKAIRPSKEELEILIWQKPMKEIGKDHKVSDSAIKKWCKDYGITNFPGRGYWEVQKCFKQYPIEFLEKIIDTMSISQISKKYGINHRTLKKMAKKYGLILKPKDYWHKKEMQNRKNKNK